jgi:hypothetical protein
MYIADLDTNFNLEPEIARFLFLEGDGPQEFGPFGEQALLPARNAMMILSPALSNSQWLC